jgi:hypothetical protein
MGIDAADREGFAGEWPEPPTKPRLAILTSPLM